MMVNSTQAGESGFGNERIILVSTPAMTPPTRAFDAEQDIALVEVGINDRLGPTVATAKH